MAGARVVRLLQQLKEEVGSFSRVLPLAVGVEEQL